MNNIKYLLSADAPANQFTKAHSADAGFDLCAAEAGSVAPGMQRAVSTGLRVSIPEGFVGLVKSRSGLAFKKGVEVGAGVVDSGYTGEVKVLLHNLCKDETYFFDKGTRIAQMVVIPIYNGCTAQVVSEDELGTTDRGTHGFGSTGEK